MSCNDRGLNIKLNQFKMKTKLFTYLTLLIIVIGMNGCSKKNSYVPVGTNSGNTTGSTTGNTTGNTTGYTMGDTTGSTTTSPGANEVWMQNTTFVPATKTISAGTTITWTNKDVDNHDVASNSGLFTSPSMGQNATYSYTFATAGTFNYKCAFHNGMNGTIIVQ